MPTGHRHYYLDSGIFQAFGLRPYGEFQKVLPVEASVLKRDHYPTTWWGQTCDSCDWILKDQVAPEYHTGEWVISPDFGAYNKTLENSFNGFDLPEVIYI